MKTNDKMKNIGNKILDILFPKHIKCIFCGEELNEKSTNDTCTECMEKLPFITRPCLRCGGQMADSYSNVCPRCNVENHNFTQARSVLVYTNSVVSLVHKFKYHKKHYLAEPMVQFIGEAFAKWSIMPDFVCDVPMHPNKQKKKKNHSTILATTLADMFKLTYLPICEKVKDNPSQTELNFKERKRNVENAYTIKPEFRKAIKGKTILIIDDVITTCATIDELSKTLLKYGASEVYALSFAHTQVDTNDALEK